MKTLVRKFLYFFGLEGIARLVFLQSDLKENGWFLSVKKKQSIDKNGNPIPWITYPLIDFIGDRLNKTMDVFEFGSGNSSLYFASKTKSIISIEHHEGWYKTISQDKRFDLSNLKLELIKMPEDLAKLGYHKMAFLDDNNDYTNTIKKIDKKFDIVIVDGLFRNSCMINSVDSLKEGGVIILDNTSVSYTPLLQKGIEYVESKGYRRLPFWGMGPIYSTKTCTSIFYKDNNCLGI